MEAALHIGLIASGKAWRSQPRSGVQALPYAIKPMSFRADDVSQVVVGMQAIGGAMAFFVMPTSEWEALSEKYRRGML